MKPVSLSLLMALAACGYSPPPQTNTANPAYASDLETCHDQAATDVNTTNAKTGLAWFASPFRRWSQIQTAEGTCMTGRGYGQLRWCTADELRGGSRRGNVIVTSSGVQCSDPPTPDRGRPTSS